MNIRYTHCLLFLVPGGISFWNAEERKLEEDSKIHRTCVTAMVWTASGDRLVTGDENGRVRRPAYAGRGAGM